MVRAAVSLAVVLLLGAAPLSEDPPVITPAKPGGITGTIAPAGQIASIAAVSRITGKTYERAEFDAAAGTFNFTDLPGDASYDIVIILKDGRQIEGIDLDFVDARLLRLAELRRAQLGLPAEPPRPFTRADANGIIKLVADMEDFCDLRRVLYIAGHGRRATALVELMRARDFYDRGDDEVIWRVELWYFQFSGGAWQRLANQERILRRERLPAEQWRRIDVEYYPDLSVYVSPDGISHPVTFTIPAAPDPSRGRPAGSEPQIKTTPIVLGLDRDLPSSAPAGRGAAD